MQLHPCATCRSSRWTHSPLNTPTFKMCAENKTPEQVNEHEKGSECKDKVEVVPEVKKILKRMWDQL